MSCPEIARCEKLGWSVHDRYRQHCDGTSGLPEWRRQYHLRKLQEHCEAWAKTQRFPPFIRRLVTFVLALWRHWRNRWRLATRAQELDRLCRCLECEANIGGRCIECGCPIARKVRWAGESCPRGLWAAVGTGRCGCG